MVDAREYHERTNHTPAKLRSESFELDFDNQPRPYKEYLDLPTEQLSAITPPQAPTLSIVAETLADPLASTDESPPAPPDREGLATLSYLSNGITSTAERQGRELAYRAAACTGKLYHIDAYLVCGNLADLPAGVYHFDPRSFALNRLRNGDFRGNLASASGRQQGIDSAPVTVVLTSTWWRNAWKYRDRTYRHAFWDSGTVLANMLATAHARGYRAEVVAAFAADPVVELLGIDPTHEAPLELVPIGRGDRSPEPRSPDPIDPATEPLSETVVEYPLIHDAWEQSTVADEDAVAPWRSQVQQAGTFTREVNRDNPDDEIQLEPVDHEAASARPLYATIQRRGSCREYAADSLSSRKLATVLHRATRGVPADWRGETGAGLQFNEIYAVLTDVAGIPDGSYRFDPDSVSFHRVGPASSEIKTNLALGQSWAGGAHVNVYLLADVEEIVESLGNRGYRLAQLEAGIVLGRLYLATYAHRVLGGTGLTFFDDVVAEHFHGPHADRTPTVLFAFGIRDDA